MNFQKSFVAGGLCLLLAACQSTPVIEENAVSSEPAPTYSDQAYRDLVKRYRASDGEAVDYAAWQANTDDMAALDGYIALLAAVSPDSHPEQFPSDTFVKSYWINAYNALVLDAVLEYWPLDSVQDVKISFSSRVVPGKGFFYDREVVVGGRTTNLYDLEKEVLKRQKDPRLHFAFNCASESCPILQAGDWTDEQLDAAAREFVNKPENVAVEDGTIWLSRIFKWYKKDFPTEIADYLADYAEPELAVDLRRGADNDYSLKYREYDWSLNDSGDS